MDVGAKREVLDLIKELKAEGVAIILMSTEPETVLAEVGPNPGDVQGTDHQGVRRRAGQQGSADELRVGQGSGIDGSGDATGGGERPLGDAGSPQRSRQADRALNWASRNARLLAPLVTLISMFIFFSLATDVFLTTQNLQNVVTQVAPIAVRRQGSRSCCSARRSTSASRRSRRSPGCWRPGSGSATSIALGNWGIPVAHPRRRGDRTDQRLHGGLRRHSLVHDDAGDAHHRPGHVRSTSARANRSSRYRRCSKQLGSVSSQIFGIPVIGLVALVVLMLGEFVLSYTKFGRYVYMTGANREAAEMSGVNTRQVVMLSLVICRRDRRDDRYALHRSPQQRQPVRRRGHADQHDRRGRAGRNVALRRRRRNAEHRPRSADLRHPLQRAQSVAEHPDHFKQALQGIVLLAALLLNVFALRIERVQTRNE